MQPLLPPHSTSALAAVVGAEAFRAAWAGPAERARTALRACTCRGTWTDRRAGAVAHVRADDVIARGAAPASVTQAAVGGGTSPRPEHPRTLEQSERLQPAKAAGLALHVKGAQTPWPEQLAAQTGVPHVAPTSPARARRRGEADALGELQPRGTSRSSRRRLIRRRRAAPPGRRRGRALGRSPGQRSSRTPSRSRASTLQPHQSVTERGAALAQQLPRRHPGRGAGWRAGRGDAHCRLSGARSGRATRSSHGRSSCAGNGHVARRPPSPRSSHARRRACRARSRRGEGFRIRRQRSLRHSHRPARGPERKVPCAAPEQLSGHDGLVQPAPPQPSKHWHVPVAASQVPWRAAYGYWRSSSRLPHPAAPQTPGRCSCRGPSSWRAWNRRRTPVGHTRSRANRHRTCSSRRRGAGWTRLAHVSRALLGAAKVAQSKPPQPAAQRHCPGRRTGWREQQGSAAARTRRPSSRPRMSTRRGRRSGRAQSSRARSEACTRRRRSRACTRTCR